MNVNVALVDDISPETQLIASEAGPAPKRVVVGYGFWIFLLSDIVMFAALFAAYAVLAHATAGGPGGAQLFNQVSVAIETGCLLASSYTCGLMSLAVGAQSRFRTYLAAVVTFALGAAFLTLELREFAGMIAVGATPQRSAFLSAFFTLVGCHGLHVAVGLIWLLLSREVYDYCTLVWSTADERLAQAALSVTWTAYAALLLWIGFALRHALTRWASLVVFAVTVAKVFLYDLSGLDGLFRIMAFLILSLVLAAAAWGYQRFQTYLHSGTTGRSPP